MSWSHTSSYIIAFFGFERVQLASQTPGQHLTIVYFHSVLGLAQKPLSTEMAALIVFSIHLCVLLTSLSFPLCAETPECQHRDGSAEAPEICAGSDATHVQRACGGCRGCHRSRRHNGRQLPGTGGTTRGRNCRNRGGCPPRGDCSKGGGCCCPDRGGSCPGRCGHSCCEDGLLLPAALQDLGRRPVQGNSCCYEGSG